MYFKKTIAANRKAKFHKLPRKNNKKNLKTILNSSVKWKRQYRIWKECQYTEIKFGKELFKCTTKLRKRKEFMEWWWQNQQDKK